MGYRSDVAYRIMFTNKTVLNEFIALVMVKGGYVVKALKECEIEKGYEDTYYVNFYQGDTKWYDDFPEVIGHHELIAFAVERFPDDAGYRFVRIGEEPDDVQEDEEGGIDMIPYEDFYVRREISLPFSHRYNALGDTLALIP